jgi:hypothetical protein
MDEKNRAIYPDIVFATRFPPIIIFPALKISSATALAQGQHYLAKAYAFSTWICHS